MNSSSTPLVEIRNYILEKFDLREILGIILVGSYAAGRAKKNSDIDIIILKKNQPSVFERREIRYHEYELDIKLYRHSYLEDTLEREATTSNQLGEISLFLRFLQEAVIWYQKELYLDKFISNAKNWTWKPEYKHLLEFKGRKPQTRWGRRAFDEHLRFLKEVKESFKSGTPISHRQKDYLNLLVDFKESTARVLMELTTQVFLELEIRREWTEYKDAKKALIFKDWGAAVASLKDVLKFQIRNALDLSHIQLLDPVIWWYAEEGNLPISLRKALEYIYNSEEDFFQTPLKRRKETLPRR